MSYIGKQENDPNPVLHASGWDQVIYPEPEDTFYAVTGNESQVLTVKLAPGDSLQGEPGSMFYMSDEMKQSVSCNDCFARCCTGEDCCTVFFTNSGSTGLSSYAALTPNFPTAKVIPVNLGDSSIGGSLVCQKGSYMASYGKVHVQIDCDCNFIRCCCGGMGLVRQRLVGDGTVFLSSSGTMVQKILQQGETILVDTNCLLAYASNCKIDVQRVGGVMGMLGGGEGIFNTTVSGPGLVIVQSMNELIFIQALAAQKFMRR